ncbi:MAG TPA: multidrug effflux MFS transporter [Rhizobiaceae bacterium]|nr:multidrug effflux MFS transporter [Rhizobiaceae bacterium]
MTANFLRLAIVLGLVSAIGPFAIDMYLPALPIIGADLGASDLSVQMSLVVVFLAFAVGPLIVGPLADIYGRKPILYGGLIVFALASVGAVFAPNVGWLIVFRLVQGLGASTGMVVPRAVVRDLHTGAEATRLMSLLMLVFSVSPILAPLVGSFIIDAFGWRAVFWAVAIAAVLAYALMALALEETRPVEARGGSSFASSLQGYKVLAKDTNFLGLVLIGGFGIASFFVYLANSSFVLIDHYGLSPSTYSLFFSLNAVSFFAVSQLSGWMTAKFGLRRVVRLAVFGYAAVMAGMYIVMASGFESLTFMTIALFFGYGFLGLVIPTTSVLAMEDHGEIAGTASALMGTLHMITGVAAMTVTSLFANGRPMPMVTGIAGAAAIAFLLTLLTLRGEAREADVEENVETVQVPAE